MAEPETKDDDYSAVREPQRFNDDLKAAFGQILENKRFIRGLVLELVTGPTPASAAGTANTSEES